MYFVYIIYSKTKILSLKDNKQYVGFTNNIKNRIHEHNSGLVDATKYRQPLELVYFEACLDKQKAIKREKYFKTGFGRRYLKARI